MESGGAVMEVSELVLGVESVGDVEGIEVVDEHAKWM